MPNFEHLVFVCTNERDKSAKRGSCGHENADKLRDALKDAVKDAGLKHTVRVVQSGCLDQCEHAAVFVVEPDHVWYGFAHARDAEEIVTEHLIGGRPVERLRLPETCINAKHCPHIK